MKNINKNLYLLLGGQLISQLGDRFYAIALAFWVLNTTKSPSMMGILLFCSMLPEIILGFFVGGFIDKYSRKAVLVISDIVRGVVIIGIVIIFYLNMLNTAIIIIAQILLSICAAFFNPTAFAVIPQIVETEQISKANFKSQFVKGLTSIAGPILGGVIVAYMGYAFIFIFNALSFFISALLEGLLRIPVITRNIETMAKVKENIKEKIFEGYRYIFARKKVLIILVIVAIIHFFVGSIQVIMPVFATKLPGNGAQNLGYIETFFGIGTILIAFIMSLFNIGGKEVKLLFGSIFMIGLIYMMIGIINGIGVNIIMPFLFLFLMLSATFIIAGTSFQIILQKNIENEMAGRVFGIVGSVGTFSIPIASLVYGVMLSYINYYYLLIFSGLVLLPASISLYFVYSKKTHQLSQE